MSGSVSDAVAMTLAGIAYGSPDRIARYVREAAMTWDHSVAWLAAPPEPPHNFAYLTVDRRGAAVLAIRGMYTNPYSVAFWNDAAQINPLQPMQPWSGDGGARIGGGTATGLESLLALKDANGVSLTTAIDRLHVGMPLTVTGHSLGGTLAPVLALHLSTLKPGRSITAISFAGMTPGNAAFARLFEASGAPAVRRVYNTLDTVAYGWDRVLDTIDFYEPAPRGGPKARGMVTDIAAQLVEGGYDYTAVGLPVALPGYVRPPVTELEFVAYLYEMLHQHLPDTYLNLLGAPHLPFSIGYGAIVRDGGGQATADPPPVAYL